MELYTYSYLILLAPLFSFAVIIFGTRVWDMLSRPHEAAVGHEDTMAAPGAHGDESHRDAHAVEAQGAHGDDHGEHGDDDDEDPKVPRLTMGARVSGYVAIVIMALA